ncbi:MAG: hypothetical protein HYZ52_07145 [Candidatus Omnitrophica bacterium]|nr:hypothetical protein [Candidatus Omnitrophota bacterium]
MTKRKIFLFSLVLVFIGVSQAVGSQTLPADIKNVAIVVREVPPQGGKAAPMPGQFLAPSTLNPEFVYGREIKPVEFLDKRTIALRELPSWYYTISNLQKEINEDLELATHGRGLNPIHVEQASIKDGIGVGDFARGILTDSKADAVVVFHYFLASDWQGTNVYFDPYLGNKYNYSSAQATRSGVGIWYEYAVFTSGGLLYRKDENAAIELSLAGTRQKAKQRLIEFLQKDLQKKFLK